MSVKLDSERQEVKQSHSVMTVHTEQQLMRDFLKIHPISSVSSDAVSCFTSQIKSCVIKV